ncbi:uncharacterized protein METZ01_LOCUS407315 [marine metagenome]|uniref:Uncharacterized protein n=1 Tax=marine metagenome TaxID=408172 RepID=A0A382W8M8_9ZZZZ
MKNIKALSGLGIKESNDCDINKIQIEKSLKLILSREFRNKIKNLKNPLLAASPSEEMYNEIINFDFPEELTKNFYDIDLG